MIHFNDSFLWLILWLISYDSSPLNHRLWLIIGKFGSIKEALKLSDRCLNNRRRPDPLWFMGLSWKPWRISLWSQISYSLHYYSFMLIFFSLNIMIIFGRPSIKILRTVILPLSRTFAKKILKKMIAFIADIVIQCKVWNRVKNI